MLLEHVSFEVQEGEKVAIVGPNGTGKTTLLRQIAQGTCDAVSVRPNTEIGFLSQNHSETLNEDHTIFEEFEELGFETKIEVKEYLSKYFFPEEVLDNRIGILSGGEKNLLQLAKISAGKANLLLFDEPTSHLDIYSQAALEKALANYKGTVLMVSHDFYSIVNTMDYVLLVEEKTIRKMRVRSFRKLIYKNYFEQEYLEQIRYICLVFSDSYIEEHFEDIKAHASDVEQRIDDDYLTKELLYQDHHYYLGKCMEAGVPYLYVDKEYEISVEEMEKYL